MLCPNCKQPNERDQNYCRFCGAPLPQPQAYEPPRPPKPYAWASPSSPLNNLDSGGEPQAVEPLTSFQQPSVPVSPAVPSSGGYRCPRCSSSAPPMVKSKISSGGWVVFVVMLLFCFPLFWIGFLMREEYRVCPACLLELS